MQHGKALEALSRESLISYLRVVLCVLGLVALSAGTALSAAPVALDADGSGTAVGVPTANPNIYTVSIVVAGRSPQFGDFRALAHHVTDTTTGVISQGFVTLEFVSGDKLYGSYAGSEAATSSPAIFTASGTVTFTGGTRHFEGVTGTGSFDGELQILVVAQSGVVTERVTLHLHGRLKF